MGIQGLIPYLKKATHQTNIKEFKGSTVAIDSYCWLHRGAFACAEKLAVGEKTDQYVLYCMKFVNTLLSFDIKPIMVFDGCRLPSKKEVELARRERRDVNRRKAAQLLREGKKSEARDCLAQCIDITPQMALDLMNSCRDRGVDCIVAPYEADSQLAYLNKIGLADIIITEDSDLVLFGCEKILFKMDVLGNGLLYERCKLSACVDLPLDQFSYDKFLKICIISGCDYLSNLPGIGLAKATKIFKLSRQTDMRQVIRKIPSLLKMSSLVITDEYVEAFFRAENTFLYQLVFDPIKRKLYPLNAYPPDIDPSQLTYAGPIMSDEKALQIALGNINVNTGEKIFNFNPDINKPKCVDISKSNSFSCHKRSVQFSIWDHNFVKAQKKKCDKIIEESHKQPCPSTKGKEVIVYSKFKASNNNNHIEDEEEDKTMSNEKLLEIYNTDIQEDKEKKIEQIIIQNDSINQIENSKRLDHLQQKYDSNGIKNETQNTFSGFISEQYSFNKGSKVSSSYFKDTIEEDENHPFTPLKEKSKLDLVSDVLSVKNKKNEHSSSKRNIFAIKEDAVIKKIKLDTDFDLKKNEANCESDTDSEVVSRFFSHTKCNSKKRSFSNKCNQDNIVQTRVSDEITESIIDKRKNNYDITVVGGDNKLHKDNELNFKEDNYFAVKKSLKFSNNEDISLDTINSKDCSNKASLSNTKLESFIFKPKSIQNKNSNYIKIPNILNESGTNINLNRILKDNKISSLSKITPKKNYEEKITITTSDNTIISSDNTMTMCDNNKDFTPDFLIEDPLADYLNFSKENIPEALLINTCTEGISVKEMFKDKNQCEMKNSTFTNISMFSFDKSLEMTSPKKNRYSLYNMLGSEDYLNCSELNDLENKSDEEFLDEDPLLFSSVEDNEDPIFGLSFNDSTTKNANRNMNRSTSINHSHSDKLAKETKKFSDAKSHTSNKKSACRNIGLARPKKKNSTNSIKDNSHQASISNFFHHNFANKKQVNVFHL